MHPTLLPAITGAPTTKKIDMPSSDANQPHVRFVANYRNASKGKKKIFATKEEAIAFARTKNPDFRCDPIREAEAEEYARTLAECANRLNGYGKTIKDATNFFIQHLEAEEKSCTVAKLVDEFLVATQNERAGSQFELDDLRFHLATFAKTFDRQSVAAITSTQIDDWLRSLNLSIVRRNHCRQLIMRAFNFAVQRGYTSSNPVFARFVVSRPF
jgi:hypothetical protein